MTPPKTDFISPLFAWYYAQGTELPWRGTGDPYKVWLSEMMLQQTQITTVIPYFLKFTATFPTVEKLAQADLDTVLKLWEGLGYYSRARNLHQAAKTITEKYGGQFPATAEELQTLSGIGRYTAGAIASIAFGEAVPVLDGNVIRVLSRLFNVAEDVTRNTTKEKLWDLAAKLVPTDGSVGDYNQALMELGQIVCKPRQPLCSACPVSAFCQAYQAGVQAERPVKAKKARTPHYDVTAGLIRNEHGQLLIAKRPEDKLLGGLWEFPGGKFEPEQDDSLPSCLARELEEELGIQVQVGDFFTKVNHAFTHFKITLHAFHCTFLPAGGEPQALQCAGWAWVNEADLGQYAFGKADREIIAALQARGDMLF